MCLNEVIYFFLLTFIAITKKEFYVAIQSKQTLTVIASFLLSFSSFMYLICIKQIIYPTETEKQTRAKIFFWSYGLSQFLQLSLTRNDLNFYVPLLFSCFVSHKVCFFLPHLAPINASLNDLFVNKAKHGDFYFFSTTVLKFMA